MRTKLPFVVAGAIVGPAASLSYAQGPAISSEVIEVSSDYSYGYKMGVKQPVGSYHLGRSVHQISRLLENPDQGNPDYLLWVDEHTGEARMVAPATGGVEGGAINPGGMSVFASNPTDPGELGRMWFAYGARGNDMPFDLHRSLGTHSPDGFELMLEDFVSDQGSTVPCLAVSDDRLLFTYRNGGSSWARVTVRFQRYDTLGLTLEHELDLGSGHRDLDRGNYGIEQLWTRYDPRYDRISASWQWFLVEEDRFGSNPYVYSEDNGDTWMTADGAPMANLPVDYTQIDSVLVPFDHLATPDQDTHWLVSDLGVAPDGTNWMTLPNGDAAARRDWTVYFWFWNGTAWEHRDLTEGLLPDSKPHACVVTRDYIVLAYSHFDARNELRVRVSRDSGRTWGEPTVVDVIEDHSNGTERHICWVSAIQPASRYLDNTARFVTGYYRFDQGSRARRYKNNIRWVKVQVGARSDFNADDVVNTIDFTTFLNAWSASDWTADFTDDGTVDTRDVIEFLQAFVAER